MMSQKMYFEKELWTAVFGDTKYFNQKPWDVATNRKLLVETNRVIHFLYSDFLKSDMSIEDYYYTIVMAIKNHRVTDSD